MLKNLNAEALMQDARNALAEANRLMAAGDWRDAAEKGWLATRNSTAALIWETTGVRNRTSAQINAGIRQLARQRGGQWEDLRMRYGDFAHNLHSQAFYDGVYDDDIPLHLQRVANYIRQAETLAA